MPIPDYSVLKIMILKRLEEEQRCIINILKSVSIYHLFHNYLPTFLQPNYHNLASDKFPENCYAFLERQGKLSILNLKVIKENLFATNSAS